MLTGHLPTPATLFIGRAEELAEIAALLTDPACRLLTLVGPGGIGKTRLALEAGRPLTFPNGVYFAPLQPLTSSDLIVPAIAEALQFQFYPGGEPKQQLLDYLREKALLLVLDNFEHLLDGAEFISQMLADAPGLKVLATSREALNLQEEWVYPTKGMRFPETSGADDVEGYSAVRLFVQHARRMRADFALEDEQASVIRICQLVEGMPLGIELASAWVRALSCAEIADEIERSLDILATSTRNVPPRHRNMRAVLEHSWNLLTDQERSVFKRLSTFRGGFRKEAAQAVADATLPTLSAMADKSLLRVNIQGRYEIHELLRQYGEEKLSAVPDEHEQTRDRHRAYYAEYMQRQWQHLRSYRQRAAIVDIEAEIDNVRSAWGRMIEQLQAAEIRKSTDALWYFLNMGCRYSEALDMFGQAAAALRLAHTQEDVALALGHVLARQAWFYNDVNAAETGKTLAEESLVILKRFDIPQETMAAFASLALATCFLAEKTETQQAAQEGLRIARASGDLWWVAWFLEAVMVRAGETEPLERLQIGTEGLPIAEQLGDPLLIAALCRVLSFTEHELKRFSPAKRYLERSLTLSQASGHLWGIAVSYGELAGIAAHQQDFAEARRYFRQELEIDLAVGSRRWQTDTLFYVTMYLFAQDEKEWAVELLALIRQHPATPKSVSNRTESCLTQLQAELAPDVFAAAVERGKALDFDLTVREVVADFSEPAEHVERQTAIQPLKDSLTERERDILRRIAEGRTNREIADQLVLALGTVKWYISEIYSKLGVESRTQAIARARELDLLS